MHMIRHHSASCSPCSTFPSAVARVIKGPHGGKHLQRQGCKVIAFDNSATPGRRNHNSGLLLTAVAFARSKQGYEQTHTDMGSAFITKNRTSNPISFFPMTAALAIPRFKN